MPPVNGTPQEALRVEGDLAFGGVYVGASRDRSITVSNPGRASRSVEVQLGAPFAAIERFTVAGGDAVQLQVTFTPTAPGPAEVSLTIDQTVVAVTGEGLAPLACAPPDPCSGARFDPLAGACVVTPLPEDSACAAPCVRDGHCRAGLCVGAQDLCDDADPCTSDACSAISGCLHSTVSCAAPTDLCQAAVCDATTGCGVVPVVDGVPCGADDCVRGTSNVCITGRCVERPRPAGLLCFEALAGVAGGPGNVDGLGSNARFFSNRVITVDRFGTTVVFDKKGVRRVTPGGLVSTLVTADETAAVRDGVGSAGFALVRSASADAWGNVLFVDGHGACVRELTPLGAVRTLAPGCTLERVAEVVRTLDRRVWLIADDQLAELRADGTLVTLRALRASGDKRLGGATGSALLFNDGSDVYAQPLDGGTPALIGTVPDQLSRLWSLREDNAFYSRVTDAGCEHGFAYFDGGIAPRHFTPAQGANTCLEVWEHVSTFTGAMLLNLIAQEDAGLVAMERGTALVRLNGSREFIAGAVDRVGTADGFGPDAGLNVTAGFGLSSGAYDALTVDTQSEVLFADSLGRSFRSWNADAGVQTITRFVSPLRGLSPALDGGAWTVAGRFVQLDGGLFVDEYGLYRFDPQSRDVSFSGALVVTRDAGPAPSGWFTQGQAAMSSTANDVVLLSPQRVFVRFDAQWSSDLVFESPGTSAVDGTIPDAGLEAPRAPVLLPNGDVVFIDGNMIRRISGWSLSTIAGTSAAGYVDMPGRAARFNHPLGLALHPNGELLVADTENNVIRAVSPLGLVRTVGRLTDRPSAVAAAPNGDVYVLVRHALLRGR